MNRLRLRQAELRTWLFVESFEVGLPIAGFSELITFNLSARSLPAAVVARVFLAVAVREGVLISCVNAALHDQLLYCYLTLIPTTTSLWWLARQEAQLHDLPA